MRSREQNEVQLIPQTKTATEPEKPAEAKEEPKADAAQPEEPKQEAAVTPQEPTPATEPEPTPEPVQAPPARNQLYQLPEQKPEHSRTCKQNLPQSHASERIKRHRKCQKRS